MFINTLCIRGEVTNYGCKKLFAEFVCEVGEVNKQVSFVEFQATFFRNGPNQNCSKVL